MDKKFDFLKDARSRKMIAAHRGSNGGNIPCNTPASFDVALYDGADLLELDVEMSAEGTLYCFHGGNEFPHLQVQRSLTSMTDEEIKPLRYCNEDLVPTVHPVYKLDDIFDYLKGRCYINVDKFVKYMDPISKCIRRHGIQDQVVVKFDVKPNLLEQLEEIAPDLNFMAVMTTKDDYTEWLVNSKINYVGLEAVFANETDPICQPEYIQDIHKRGLILWANGIVFNYKRVLSAGHNDDISVAGRPDEGWGWLIDRGFDIIQTDWTCQLRHYMNSRGL